ncbi:MAG: cytochrome ubiquinol oxidase subunit I [Anaerolineales bacterium]|jgi:cytochrome d ubiquinol oxidase subunit I
MDIVTLARWHFAITTVYHFFFVPITLGLSVLVALMETTYLRTGNERYKRMTKFWGKLFLINFAMGVVTGIVMEFQFGMNWSEYSRFVGDVFGAPLAIEALLAFFLESTFLGMWIFGWERLSKRAHAVTIWLVAIGANVSALWILIANSFMQEPVGYALSSGRAEMVDFGALVTNPHVWLQFPHVFASGLTTASFFILGISAYHLLRKTQEIELFKTSFKWAAITGLVAAGAVGLIGHAQGQHMMKTQPMKMAAGEALWNSEDPASLSLFTIIDEKDHKNLYSIEIPRILSFMAFNRMEGMVHGINQLQAEYEQTYGPGNYIPPVTISFWTFRIMVGVGLLMILLAAVGLWQVWRGRLTIPNLFLKILPWAIVLPFIANTSGWIFTEVGRQPWIVFGLLRTENSVSPTLSAGTLLFSLISFGLIYSILIAVDVYLLRKYATQPELELLSSEQV